MGIQPDQKNMAVMFWYLVNRDATVRYCRLAYTGQIKFYRKTPQCITGHTVYNVKKKVRKGALKI